jgi:hypothetical protein
MVGTLPVMLYHFGACHPWGAVTNLMACPLLALAISSGGLALAVSSLATSAAHVIVLPAILALRAILGINAAVASAPWHTLVAPPVPFWIALLSLAFLLLPNRRRAAAGTLGVLSLLWLLPAPLPPPGRGVVFALDRGEAMVYQSGRTSLLITSRARPRELSRILRAMNVRRVDVAIDPAGTGVPVPARRVLSSPGTTRVCGDLEVRVDPGRGARLSVEVRAEGTRFVFGTPRADATLPLLVARAAPEEVIACEARRAILTGRPEAFLRYWPTSSGAEVRFVQDDGALQFTVDRDGEYRIRPLYVDASGR